VLTMGRLRGLGYDHAAISREVENDRWTRLGTHTIALHTGTLSTAALRWRAVWEVAEDVALVDGVTALQWAGLTGYTEDVVHVSVPRGAQCPPVDGVRVHRVTRRPGESVGAGLPRTRVEVAALRGAAWARSDRQAALVLCMVVQQRLTTGRRLLDTLPAVLRPMLGPPGTNVIVAVDSAAPSGIVVQAMLKARDAGAEHFLFAVARK